MITTRTHILSSSESAFTSGGVDVYESGPTNLVVSFSGVNASGTYLKFLVKYDTDDTVYTVTTSTDNLTDIRTQSINKTFHPYAQYITTYNVDISGVKTDLTVDRYRIKLNLGRESTSQYNTLKIINSHMYTNQEGANYTLLTLEGQYPRVVGNLIVPVYKDTKWYEPAPAIPFAADDNRILRSESYTVQGSYVPLLIERSMEEVLEESQYEICAMGTEGTLDSDPTKRIGNLYYDPRVIHVENGMIPNRDNWDSTDVTFGDMDRGADVQDYIIIIPEDGIDYTRFDHSRIYEDEGTVNVTTLDIFPAGVAP